MAGDKDGKTEKPTPKKLADARKEGQVARSQELVPWASILASVTVIKMTVERSNELLRRSLRTMEDLIANPDLALAIKFMVETVRDAFVAIMPLALLFAVLAIVGSLAQTRFLWAPKSIKPNFKKINPITGVKKLFSAHNAMEAAKQVVKLVVLGYIAYRTTYGLMTGLAGNGPYALSELMRVTADATVKFIQQAAFAGLIIAFADYAFQKHKMGKQLMMTKQEIKEEGKSQEGSPEIKGKIRQKQAQMSRNRMMAEVDNADVMIVNPIHIAVAIKYDPVRGAPRVVAKGAGFVAEKLREKAEEARVPLVQDIPLARVLHKSCEIDDEIPAQMFEAVAKLLAFVFGLRNRNAAHGFHKMPGTPDLEEADRLEAAEKAAEWGTLAIGPAS